MIHQPSGSHQGQATDIEIHAKEILATRAQLNEIYAKHTDQALSVIEEAMERDRFMTPQEAKEFGLIDHVVEHRPPIFLHWLTGGVGITLASMAQTQFLASHSHLQSRLSEPTRDPRPSHN